MNRKAAVAVFALMFTGFTGCASHPMTQEEASKILSKAQVYDANMSFAKNLCQLAPGEMVGKCPSDVIISKEEFERWFVPKIDDNPKNKKKKVEIDPYHGLELDKLKDAKAKGLFDTLLKGKTTIGDQITKFMFDSEDDRTRFVAVIPADKAKDADEARRMVFDGLDKAYKTLYKKYKMTERGSFDREDVESDHRKYHYSGLIVTDKNGCDRIFEKGKLKSVKCVFVSDVNDDKINETLTLGPAWLPGGGFNAWVVTGHTRLYLAMDYLGKLDPREIAIEVAPKMPDGFYMLLPSLKAEEKDDNGKDVVIEPAMVLSNKRAYFYTIPKGE